MFLDIDPLGESLQDFYLMRDELISKGEKFNAENLQFVPYEKLAFCATGIARQAMCSMKLVRDEKKSRRERFIAMGDADVRACRTLLQIEQMDTDVRRERIRRNVPRWEDLNTRQQLWFKLNCICNHIDGVLDRIHEAFALFAKLTEERALPQDFLNHQRRKLEVLMQVYPASMADGAFRARVAEIAFELKKFLSDEEQKVCDAEVLQNYSCTSDCYSPLV